MHRCTLHTLKELINISTIATMIRDDAVKERDIEITRNMLDEGYPVKSIQRITGLDEAAIRKLQAEIEAA